MTKGFSNLNRFVTTLTSTINFLFRFVTTLISTINFMTMDFDYLNYVTSTKLKKVNDKNGKPVSYLSQLVAGTLKHLQKSKKTKFSFIH